MTTHLFGAASSPSCAIFAQKQTAKDNESQFSSSSLEFVNRHFYVDDGTTSFDSTDAALTTSLETIELLSRGGFNLHKFFSNDRILLQQLPPA